MSRNAKIAVAVRHALLAGASTLAGLGQVAYAQNNEEIQTVVVTGSRIVQPNLTSISPVVSVTSDEFKLQGTTRVEDLVNNLPQAMADFGGNLSNGATGAATVNMRGLGAQRTLVLVNGRRLMPGDPTQSGNAAPDLNQIPVALVERVEVLTGGASAVYGADAVAGVVNFILNDDFEGIRFDSQFSFYQHEQHNDYAAGLVSDRNFALPKSNVRDGYTKDFTFMAGINTGDGRGNAIVYAGYRKLQPLLQSERDFSACALSSSDAEDPTDTVHFCGGSGTTAPARFLPRGGGDFVIGDNNELRPFTTPDQYNFAPTNYYQRPDERKTAGLLAHYDVDDRMTVYTEFMFMDDRSLAQIAPSGVFLGTGPDQPPFFGDYLVNCNNPLLSASMVQEFCTNQGLGPNDDTFVNIGRRNVESGGRLSDLRHTSYRTVVGLRGDITDDWRYDVYGLYGTTVYAQRYERDLSRTRVNKALNAVRAPNGSIVCRVNADADLSNDDPLCVPLNIFQNGGITPAQLAYVEVPGFQEGSTVETIVSAAITGDLGARGVKLPWASNGLGIAFGAEYRQEESELDADLAFQTNDLQGQGSPTLDTHGRFDAQDLFTEARLPLVQDRPFAKTLSVEAGYRWSDYSLGFSTDTYKLGADWAPADVVRFRASYQRAVRAPNIQELFLGPRVQLNGSQDPCAADPGDSPAATLEQCARTGVSAAQYGNILANPAGQYNGLIGGNPDLDPESADTYSFGFVFTPAFLEGFSLAVDYYDIEVEDLIGIVGQDFTLRQCLNSGSPEYCALIHRSPETGSLWLGSTGHIEDPIVNTGSLETSGVDVEMNYRFALGDSNHQLALQLIGTHLAEFIAQPDSRFDLDYDCAGLYGSVCLVPTPEWRHKVRATWSTPWDLELSLSWRFIEEVAVDGMSTDPDLGGPFARSDARLGSRSYLDLAGTYTWKNVSARVGINNLLDKDPPLTGADNCPLPWCNGNTFPQVYDTLGRYGFAGLTVDF